MPTLKALAQNVVDIQYKIYAKKEAVQDVRKSISNIQEKREAIQPIKKSLEDLQIAGKEAEAALSAVLFDPADEYDGPISIDLGDKVLVCDWDSDGEGSWSMKAARKY